MGLERPEQRGRGITGLLVRTTVRAEAGRGKKLFTSLWASARRAQPGGHAGPASFHPCSMPRKTNVPREKREKLAAACGWSYQGAHGRHSHGCEQLCSRLRSRRAARGLPKADQPQVHAGGAVLGLVEEPEASAPSCALQWSGFSSAPASAKDTAFFQECPWL